MPYDRGVWTEKLPVGPGDIMTYAAMSRRFTLCSAASCTARRRLVGLASRCVLLSAHKEVSDRSLSPAIDNSVEGGITGVCTMLSRGCVF